MGLLDGFEKLITEHGSAAILKERIALANDKYAALEQKLLACESTKKELHSENETLRLDLEKATVEVQNLKKLTDKSHSDRLDDVKEKILAALAEGDKSKEELLKATGLLSQSLIFHMENNQMNKLATGENMGMGLTVYSLTAAGREYCVLHGLLSTEP